MFINPFHATDLFLYPLKTSKPPFNHSVSPSQPQFPFCKTNLFKKNNSAPFFINDPFLTLAPKIV